MHWLICVLPLSSPLQSLDLDLSSISFIIAYRVSIILIKSNLFHKIINRYVIYDEEALAAKGGQVSLPEQEREWAKTEQDFMQAYLKRTGIHYRHYFERGQPRPKVSLFMWPAPSVGAGKSISIL